ncbi:MAG TPA: TetR/AcrR family transcriptional regulator [Ktedonobacterales bacterium]|nr:TetR/AcrR family transcriptional regulator [Ktedonobacterales bacterium]
MARRAALPGVDRRQQILEAALDIFAENGFEGATTKEIASRADVTQGLIYFYFPSKEDLFFAAFDYQAAQLAERMYGAIETEGRPPEEVLREMIGRLVDALATPRSVSLLRIMQRTAVHSDPTDAREHSSLEAARCRIKEQARRIGGMFKPYIEEQIAAGALRPVDPSLATQLFMGAVMTTVMRRASGDAEFAHYTSAQLVDSMVDVLVCGLLPRTGVPLATAPPG